VHSLKFIFLLQAVPTYVLV